MLKKYCRNFEKFLKYEYNWLEKNIIDYDLLILDQEDQLRNGEIFVKEVLR